MGLSIKGKISFPVFFMLWAQKQGWTVPALHLQICEWLEHCDARVRVLMVFRGAAKSTIYSVYKAWLLYTDATLRNQVWAADDNLAMKMSRLTRHVLLTHSLCAGMISKSAGTEQFWTSRASDFRNPSMAANGILSNATGSRADKIDFDDIEVPKNIRTLQAREMLRERIAETTHILVPGGQKTFLGTPHTHESIYDEQVTGGASLLRIPLFQHSMRYEETTEKTRYRINFSAMRDGLCVIAGIGKFARLLVKEKDYRTRKNEVIFNKPPGVVLDICTGNAWHERFTHDEILFKRRECHTLNEWDSQYQLHSKPIYETRLDPERMVVYAVEPEIRVANNKTSMWLGRAQIIAASAYWDCALGKVGSDDSVFSLVLSDQNGKLYWQVAEALSGDLDQQCKRIRALAVEYNIPRVVLETNGAGGFVPPILRKHLSGIRCAVGEVFSVTNKQQRILAAFDAPLSSRFLWAHISVIEGAAYQQMRDFNPADKNQRDDYLDSGAGAITETPIRLGKAKKVGKPTGKVWEDWRPDTGVHEVTLEH